MIEALRVLQRFVERAGAGDAEALGALEDLLAYFRDQDAVTRFVNGRRIPAAQRILERALVVQHLERYRQTHRKVTMRSAKEWIARVSRLPPSRVREYLEQITAEQESSEGVRDGSRTLCEPESLTASNVLSHLSPRSEESDDHDNTDDRNS